MARQSAADSSSPVDADDCTAGMVRRWSCEPWVGWSCWPLFMPQR
jgi:hypothetical protein